MEKLIVPLVGSNYSTWKVQVRMILINLELWNIVSGAQVAPVGDAATTAAVSKFETRSGKALSTIVLSISPSLLYLVGNPICPVIVWKKLENHFQKPTWSNQFTLAKHETANYRSYM